MARLISYMLSPYEVDEVIENMKSIVGRETSTLDNKKLDFGTGIGEKTVQWLIESVPKQTIDSGKEECAVMVNATADA